MKRALNLEGTMKSEVAIEGTMEFYSPLFDVLFFQIAFSG